MSHAHSLEQFLTSSEEIDRFAGVKDLSLERETEETWRRMDGIWVAASIDPELLSGYDLNPLVEDVASLGEVRLLSVRTSGDGTPHNPMRMHRLYTIDREGFEHAVEITDPINKDSRYAVVSLPGFTEAIEGPIRKKMHESLALEFPEARIISIGSNGIGKTGSRYGWNERNLHGLEAMGEQRLALALALVGKEKPVFFKGTSMGTVITERSAELNTFGAPVDGRINLKGLYFLSPAIVDPSNVWKDMGFRFIPQLTVDGFREIALKTPLAEAWLILRAARRYGLSRDDFGAMGNQIIELLKGTKEEAFGRVVTELCTVVVAGEKDCLAQWPMMERQQEAHPGTLFLKKIPKRGHSLGMKPGKACATISRSGRFLVDQALAA